MTVILEDRHAPHQIVLRERNLPHRIVVSCTCLFLGRHYGFIPIAARARFPSADAIAAWAAWHEGQVIA